LPEPAKATATPPTAQTDSMIVETPAKPAKGPSAGKASAHQASHTATKRHGREEAGREDDGQEGARNEARREGRRDAEDEAGGDHQASGAGPSRGGQQADPAYQGSAGGKSAKPTEPVLPRV
jgi:hypothetical protein